jgi:CheY-like chemotaxis protein
MEPDNWFGRTAEGLAKRPLGIIALFIILIYGLASLVTAFANSLTASERLPLVWFLIVFPPFVLIVFAWLVSKHSFKLFRPADFKNEENYVKLQFTAVASLAAASTKSKSASLSEAGIENIIKAVRHALPLVKKRLEDWHTHILWVDDKPNNNIYERMAFEAVGFSLTLALSTSEALDLLKRNRYAAIISDMRRREGPREGYALLGALRHCGDQTPFFIYTSSNLPEQEVEAFERGAQGSTNEPEVLFQMVMRAVLTRT